LRFEPNQGQTAGVVRFLARGNGYTLFLTDAEAVLALARPRADLHLRRPALSPPASRAAPAGQSTPQPLNAAVVRLRLVGANRHPQVVGLDRLPGVSNYFIGNDPRRWRANVPSYARVAYRDMYPGVDQVYYGNQARLEYDLVVAPGASPRIVRLALEGPGALRLDRQGNLVLGRRGAALRLDRPRVYQEERGHRRDIAGRYVVLGRSQVGFAVGAYDTRRPLVIDPSVGLFHLPRRHTG
jgi:hypothetical protein